MNSHERRKLMVRRNKVICSYLLNRHIFEPREHCRTIFSEEQKKHGFQAALMPGIREEYPELFFTYTRMSCQQFDHLMALVGSRLTKQDTRLRKAIPAADRLTICLRFLATGANYTDLSFAYRIGKSTVCEIVKETTRAISEVLGPMVVTAPKTPEEWEALAMGFEYKWNFPNCVGAIDGKHVALKAPPSSGSKFYNYKKFYSIVLMAACDASYAFTFLDVGNYGRISDGGVFANCAIGRNLDQEPSFLPMPNTLSESDVTLPYVFVADEAFPLKLNLLKPFPSKHLTQERRIFNYRLSRARRCIENAFGILASRWRVLLTTMSLGPENATMVTLACCCLHNFLIKEEFGSTAKTYCPVNYADVPERDGSIRAGLWRDEQQRLTSVSRQGSNNCTNLSVLVRNAYAQYFSNEGSVPFQDEKISF